MSCSNLTRLTLKPAIRISPSIFQGATDAETLFWPHLQYFKIDLSMATATGQWYVEIDPETLDVVFCPDRFNPLMLAMARAVPHMPSIKSLSIDTAPTLYLTLWYEGPPGVGRQGFPRRGGKWDLFIALGTRWEIPEELRRVWEDCVGEKGIIAIYDSNTEPWYSESEDSEESDVGEGDEDGEEDQGEDDG
jgi:hypothetical protein